MIPPGVPDGIHIGIPKIPTLVYFEKSWNENSWYILWRFSTFGYILWQFVFLWSFGVFISVLVCCSKKSPVTQDPASVLKSNPFR
jgi:hypothetical protein